MSDLLIWINDLANDDEKIAASARRRLITKGHASIEPLLTILQHPKNITQYRGALRTLGDIAANGPLPSVRSTRQLLIAHLATHDGAERRSLITCLGNLGLDSAAETALLTLWKNEKRDDQLRVLAAALGRIGGQPSDTALATCTSTAPLVLREVAKARSAITARTVRTTAGEGHILADKILSNVPIRLRCRTGLGVLLLANLPATVSKARETAPGQIDAELNGSLNSLFACRLWSEAVLLAPSVPEALRGPVLRNLTSGPATWRLHLPKASRGELLDIIRAAQTAAPDLPNSPTGAVWELRPLAKEVEILPRHWADTRFEYVRETIPAMTHVPLAAALAMLSKPTAEDIVWDPFCGAGTELAERAKAGPYARLIGSDRDAVAIAAARKNLPNIERLFLQTGDSFELKFSDVNVLLTNPPYGRKIQGDNNAMLLRRLLETATRNMKRGRIILCSPLPRETWIWAIELGWKAVARHAVGTDGHLLEAQVFARE